MSLKKLTWLPEADYLRGCVPLHLPTPDFMGMVSTALLEEFIFFGEGATGLKIAFWNLFL